MNNVVDFAAYKESKKLSPFETDIKCGCGEPLWHATNVASDGESPSHKGGIPNGPTSVNGGGSIIKAEKVLVCLSCTAMVALGLEE